MKYKFENFNVEIDSPIVEINLRTIKDNAVDKLLSVDVIFITDNARFGVTAENMPYDLTWEDSDIETMLTEWLKSFEA